MVIYSLMVHVVWILIHGNIVYGANILEGTQYIGCYEDRDVNDPRAMVHEGEFKRTLTNQLCIETCKAKGFTFAGTQYSYECFCGESYDKYGTGTGCNIQCHGDPSQTCGGFYRNSVYAVCPFGTFGVQCDKQCPTNCKNAACQFINGKCVYGCDTDHDGPYCDLPYKTLKGDPRTEVGLMNDVGGTFFNLFTTLTFPENTQVKGVQYYSQISGRVYISFWRKDGTETNKWTMVDKIEIPSSSIFGPQEYLVKNRTIDVQAGDAVAVHYKAGDPGEVIPYEKSTNGQRTVNIKDENLHDVINVNIQDVDWQPGHPITYSPQSGYKKTAAIKILYNCAQVASKDDKEITNNIGMIAAVASVIGCIVIATTVIVSILIYLRCRRRSKENERENSTKETQDDTDKEKSNSDVNYIEVYEEIDVNVHSNIGNEAEENYQAMESYKPETQKTYETLRL